MKQMPKSHVKCTYVCILPSSHGTTHYSVDNKTWTDPPVFIPIGSAAINRPTAPDVPLCQNLRQTSVIFLEVLLLSILSFRQGAYGLCDKNSGWLWAGYISQTPSASPHCSSTLSESFSIKFTSTAFTLCKQAICFQLKILTIKYTMVLNFLAYLFFLSLLSSCCLLPVNGISIM